MSLTPMSKISRPLSPHLLIYRPQWSSALSILHRLSGLALLAFLPILVIWLVALAFSPLPYALLNSSLGSVVGKIFLVGCTWAFCFHFFNGLKYLVWGTGRWLALEQAKIAAGVVVLSSLLATALLWICVF